MWIWYRCQNTIENYYQHAQEQLRNEEFQFIWQKLYPSERQMPYKESWLRWIVTEQAKLQITLLKEIVLAHFKRHFGRSSCDVFWENEGKIHEGGFVKEFFSLTCRLTSRNFIID